ncbi:FUSC family protein [Rhodopseudomonas palustris]|uniref:FUSC family protein n=1 Tax=Rhodopseudomonas palustris TaxID=1076 RepID=A0AAX3DRW6_RHOPL|nr:FUSC family protein [Rhodopseudomonas palustris]UYO37608.1 FUSC family protein [Rhodopseudomonas palustris]UYO42308.1 FUSC family protein [Rhodopseudomonas palustris]UYO46964.1 FUSC family protein [Rhodopseudomonas palustris]UYO51639.1 FUSC family protein [Rhodopseudomonas palustris]
MIQHHWTWHRIKALAHEEWRELVTFNPSDRPWQMPFSAALAAGVPMLIGAYFDHLDYGLISSLGGMAFLYLPRTPLHHRMVSMMAAGFGYAACYTLGLVVHLLPWLLVPAITFTAIVVTMLCRFYRVGPPGSMFFVMAAAIAAYTPGDLMQLPLKAGLFVLGSLLATLIAMIYSIVVLRIRDPLPVPPLAIDDFEHVVLDSVVIGIFVGLALALAQALQLERPYWVPVSCLAVIQGLSVRAIWNRHLHRLLGTAIGLGLAAVLLALPLEKWSIAFAVIALSFVIETAVIRHYGFAVIFITPLTIFLADAATLGQEPAHQIIEARFIDTVVGCVVGLLGGVCLHHPGFRHVTARLIRRLIPAYLIPAKHDRGD